MVKSRVLVHITDKQLPVPPNSRRCPLVSDPDPPQANSPPTFPLPQLINPPPTHHTSYAATHAIALNTGANHNTDNGRYCPNPHIPLPTYKPPANNEKKITFSSNPTGPPVFHHRQFSTAVIPHCQSQLSYHRPYITTGPDIRNRLTTSDDPNLHVIPAAARAHRGKPLRVRVAERVQDRVEVLEAEEGVARDGGGMEGGGEGEEGGRDG